MRYRLMAGMLMAGVLMAMPGRVLGSANPSDAPASYLPAGDQRPYAPVKRFTPPELPRSVPYSASTPPRVVVM